MPYEDPLIWDKQTRLLAEFEELYTFRLKHDPEAADPAGPFVGVPPITERAAFAQLRELPADLPILRPLGRWMIRLADARVNAPLNRGIACFWRSELVSAAPLQQTNLTRAEIFKRVLRGGPARVEWWSALAKSLEGAPLSPSDLWQRRDELAKRAGFEGIAHVLDPVDDTSQLIEQWQDQSDALSTEVLPREPLALLDVALSMGADRGWPVHISAPSMAVLLGERTWLRLSPVKEPRWPELLGPGSFTRALYGLGMSLARAWANESYPFVLSRDPWKLQCHRLGTIVSSLVLNETWHMRVLGLNRDQARMQVRAFGAATLLASRRLCLKLALRRAAVDSAPALRRAFAESSVRLFGFELPPSMAGFVPRIGRSDAQRLLGMWLGLFDQVSLIHTFDEDWYRNPKAIEHLRGQFLERPGAPIAKEQASEAQRVSVHWLSSCFERH